MENKKQKLSLKELCTKFIPTIKKIFNYLKKVEFNKKMKLIGEILLLIVLLCLLKLPFSIARDLIINVFFSVEIANILLMNMLYIIFGLPYYILAIYLFMKNIVIKYENLEIEENIKKIVEEPVPIPLSNEVPVAKVDNGLPLSETEDKVLEPIRQENKFSNLASDTNTTESVTNNQNNSNS